jgi:hypothetical protein
MLRSTDGGQKRHEMSVERNILARSRNCFWRGNPTVNSRCVVEIHSDKDIECSQVFMLSALYASTVLTKLDFSRQIFEECLQH